MELKRCFCHYRTVAKVVAHLDNTAYGLLDGFFYAENVRAAISLQYQINAIYMKSL